ncbi:MAG: insulinase family protein [Bacteroidota bacterium]
MLLALRLKYGFLLLLGLVWGRPVLGQEVVRQTLPNGMEVVFVPDTTRILNHLSLTVRGGALLDPPDADGLSNLHAHLLADRSDSLPGDGRLVTEVAQQGMAFYHLTFAEGNFFSLSTLPPRTPNAMALLAYLLQAPGADSASLVRARALAASEIQFQEGDPEFFHEQALRQRLWGRQRHRKNILGSYVPLAALRLDWIRQYLAAYLHPRNCLLAGTGDLPAADFFALADSLFGGWKYGAPGPQIARFDPPELVGPRFFVTENAFAAQPVLSMAWPVPGAATDPAMVEQLALFAEIAGLPNGFFARELVGKGWARQIEWRYSPTWAPGRMTLRVLPEPDSLVACLEGVRDALYALGERNFPGKKAVAAGRRKQRLHRAQRTDRSLDRLAMLGKEWGRGQLAPNLRRSPPGQIAILRELAQRFTPQTPHVTGLLHNARVDLLAGLESIFRSGIPAVATAEDAVPEVAPPVEPDSLISLRPLTSFRIYFESASFQPDGPSLLNLDTVASMLHTYPEMRIYLNGYADGQGDGVFNYKLSIERARSVENVLSSAHQIDPERLVVRPFGEAFPEYPDDTPEHRALNRRVTFNVAPPDAVEYEF